MLGIKRMVIAQHERGLKWRNKRFTGVLMPGVHWIVGLPGRIEVETFDLTEPAFTHKRADFMLKEAREECERHFKVVELTDHEAGLVYRNGRLHAVLAPGTRQLYWLGPVEIRVEVQDISNEFEVPRQVAALLGRTRASALSGVLGSALPGAIPGAGANAVYAAEVPDASVGLLIVDGELKRTLQPGFYAYWKFHSNVKVDLVDLRLQSMEVSGQEILTRDKVSLRVNLSATYRVTEVVKARQELANFTDYLYRELQFALREAIGTRTLDALLGEKGELDRTVASAVRDKVSAHGLEVHSVGIKDVILPGDMKDILNKVVEAEKVAQANLIKRREETAATRSLLNTAKLMEENPTLLRLKELETLEKVTEKIDKLTVFGGLDGVLKDMVKINV